MNYYNIDVKRETLSRTATIRTVLVILDHQCRAFANRHAKEWNGEMETKTSTFGNSHREYYSGVPVQYQETTLGAEAPF